MYTKFVFFPILLVAFFSLSGCALFPQKDFVVPAMRRAPFSQVSLVSESNSKIVKEDPAIISPSKFTYSFEFPLNFSFVTNTYYAENFSSEHMAAKFPTSSVLGISDATIDVGVGEKWCHPEILWDGMGINTSTRTLSGSIFNKFSFVDAAAGNQYHTTGYFVKKENTCYAIVFFLHTTSPENYADSEEEAVLFRKKYDSELSKINTIFERTVGTFHFRNLK